MFTSCCPGWVAMVEKSNPELIPYLSTCKSPQMMLGAVIKNYFAQETGLNAADITNVSVMPCVRKQGEADREWFTTSGECAARGNVRLCSQGDLRWDAALLKACGSCADCARQLCRKRVAMSTMQSVGRALGCSCADSAWQLC